MDEALQSLKQQITHQSTNRLILFPKTKSDMNAFVTQLQAANSHEAALTIVSELEKYLNNSQVRYEALEAFIASSWKWLEPLIEQAEIERGFVDIDSYPIELQTKCSMLITFWEHVFRDFPNEASHSYLALGRQIKPRKQVYFRRFVKWVSNRLGRNVDSIIDDQIPSLE